MFSNAKIYNVDESYIFKYASRLEQALAAKYKTIVQQKKERTRSATTRKFDERKSLNTLEEKVQHLIQSVKNFTDRHGRTLSTPFLTLPLKSEYPDYYEIIRRPIDLKRIETRSYPTIEDLIADFHQMFDNACTYNEPGSTIYRVRSIRFASHFSHAFLLRRLGCFDLEKIRFGKISRIENS